MGYALSGGPVGLGPTACKPLAAVLNYVNPVDLSGMGFDDGPLVAAVQSAGYNADSLSESCRDSATGLGLCAA
jgi:hypothetical protein